MFPRDVDSDAEAAWSSRGYLDWLVFCKALSGRIGDFWTRRRWPVTWCRRATCSVPGRAPGRGVPGRGL